MSDQSIAAKTKYRDYGFAMRTVTALPAFVGDCFILVMQSLKFVFTGKLELPGLIRQMNVIGADSLPIVIATTFSTGGVFAFYTAGIFVQFGATSYVGGTLTLSILLELGPLLAGIAVAARIGAAIAAEIGSMVVTEQVDALRALAVSPIRYLVAPRLVASLLMMPVLCLFADLSGVIGCYIMAKASGVPGVAFIESARSMANESDMAKGIVKSICFGALIAIIACRQGLQTRGGAEGVGKSTTNSVVYCVVGIFIADFILTQLLQGHTWRQ